MTKRVRLARVQVTVEAFLDDGDTLTPLEVEPVTVAASKVDEIPAMLAESVAHWEQAVNAADTDAALT